MYSDLANAMTYRGVITGDLNRAMNNEIIPGYYHLGEPASLSNAPSDVSWCVFVQFYGFCTQLILSGSFIYMRKVAGNPAEWQPWYKIS